MRKLLKPLHKRPSRADRTRIAMWQVGLLHLLFRQQRVSVLRLLLVILSCLYWRVDTLTIPCQLRLQFVWWGITGMPHCSAVNRGRRLRRRRGQRSGVGTVEATCDDDAAASYARFSSDMQANESNPQQQSKLRGLADRNGHSISSELEFADEAVSGTKRDRDGLNAMLAAAEAGAFKTLYLYSLSRLARESVISLPMLKRLVNRYEVRVITLVEGLDSDRDGWELIAHVISIVNEQFLKELRESVLRGQEGALLAGYCVGDYRFGYRSEPVSGSETTRHGRRPKPRMVYVIDLEEAEWVTKIFDWFVVERRSITWIVKKLNQLGAPKDHRSTTPEWRHASVVGVLESEKYIGIWPWGEMTNVRDPETGKVRQRARDEAECQQWTRELPHLRLIDDEMFHEAQQLLEENAQNRSSLHDSRGRFRGSRPGQSQPQHLLSGIIVCGECGRRFYVGGPHGKYLFCPRYKQGLCTCQTQLQRARAERMILDEIGRCILDNREWLNAVFEATQHSWGQQEDQVPRELAAAERSLQDVQRKIDRLVDRIESGLDDASVQQRLRTRRDEKRRYIEDVQRLRGLSEQRAPEPTREWVREQLTLLSKTLQGDTPAAALALRALVGGEIRVTEVRREGRQRHVLRGCFTLRSPEMAEAIHGTRAINTDTSDSSHCEEIVIDFVDPDPIVAQSERAKELYDQQLMNVEIAKAMGCSKSLVTKLLKYWFESRGLTMPDGRARRSKLPQKQTTVSQYQQIADEAKQLWDENLSVAEIARRLDCSDMTAQKAIAAWHEKRGIPVPTARDRRQQIGDRARELFEVEGWSIKQIATEFGYSPRGMKLLIEQTYKAQGREMPDGRSGRGKQRN